MHTKMTGSPARVSTEAGESFEAWDGYIQGVNIELERPSRILQSWRTSEFDDADEDSLVEILFKPMGLATRITIRHSRLTTDGMQYRQGWIDFYFIPMKVYFGKKFLCFFA